MSLYMFRKLSDVWKLRHEVRDNLDYYRGHETSKLINECSVLELDPDFHIADLDTLKKTNKAEDDIDNSLLIWEKIKIPARLAREKRLWTYLCHTSLFSYCTSRWPLPDSDIEATEYIRKHFITENDKRAIDRDNALSRLWISAYVASLVENMDLSVALKTLLISTDFREGVIGRPTINKSRVLLTATLQVAHEIKFKNKNDDFFIRGDKGAYKRWLQRINYEGGIQVFDSRTVDEIKYDLHIYAEEAQLPPSN